MFTSVASLPSGMTHGLPPAQRQRPFRVENRVDTFSADRGDSIHYHSEHGIPCASPDAFVRLHECISANLGAAVFGELVVRRIRITRFLYDHLPWWDASIALR